MGTDGKSHVFNLKNLRLAELSLCDVPANRASRVTLFKRGEPATFLDGGYPNSITKRDFSAEERRQGAKEGWAKPDGSYPIRDKADLANAVKAWGRGGATASDKAWIIRRAKALGATDALPDNWVSKSERTEDMTPEELKKAIADAVAASTADITKQLGETVKKLSAAEATIAKMGKDNAKKPQADDMGAEPDEDDMKKRDAWRAHVDRVTKAAVKKALDDQAAIAKGEETITVAGETIRKSEVGETTFKVMKAQQAQIAEGIEKAEITDFAKKAETDYGHLPGETIAKGKALRSLNKLDEADRKVVVDMLKAGEKAMLDGMRSIGHGGGGSTGTAEAEFTKKVDDYIAVHKVDRMAAVNAVTATKEGQELYSKSMEEARARQRAH